MKKLLKWDWRTPKYHFIECTAQKLGFILLFKESILNLFYVFHKQLKLGNQLNWVALKTTSRETFRTCVPRF